MTRDARDLAASLDDATAPQFRQRLLARGQAQSMIRRDGVLPDDAPQFSSYLDDDLLSYSYALISTSLHLLDATDAESGGEAAAERLQLARNGFIQASYALEAATHNAVPAEDLAFHRLIAGAASHLGGYAARAFSLMQASVQSGRLTPMEATLGDLVLRDLDRIEERTRRLRSSADLTDDALFEALQTQGTGEDILEDDEDPGASPEFEPAPDRTSSVGPIVLLLSEHYLSAVSSALFTIAHDQSALLRAALADLEAGGQASHEISAPGPWWVYRLTRRLLGDLGETSIRANIPISRPPAATATDETSGARQRDWGYLRRTFVATLFARGRSEIDLWPSQLHAVERIFNDRNDLVVALPTSAGKTRIAELCILACLAQGRRAVYVTPLRALSAQTEQVLERTFGPLGARVSSLYGSMGISDVDEDALRTSQIVVTTPEKLDFALRSNPTVLDDVGLVVLDEGHMIGPSEREVRYEAQIQRLLRRSDTETRRIVCLSAVFPSGTELDDFVAWITNDDTGGLHREDWRPTRQWFGLVEWRSDHARLTMTLGEDRPSIPRYLEEKHRPGASARSCSRPTSASSSSQPPGAWSRKARRSSSSAPNETRSSRTPARSSSSADKDSSTRSCRRRSTSTRPSPSAPSGSAMRPSTSTRSGRASCMPAGCPTPQESSCATEGLGTSSRPTRSKLRPVATKNLAAEDGTSIDRPPSPSQRPRRPADGLQSAAQTFDRLRERVAARPAGGPRTGRTRRWWCGSTLRRRRGSGPAGSPGRPWSGPGP